MRAPGDTNLRRAQEMLDVRLLVDRPIVEVYVQGGRGAFVVAANYSVANASVHLVNRGRVPVVANVSAWQMECGWAAQLPTPNVAPAFRT